MTPAQQGFMSKLHRLGGHATVGLLGPQTTQAENSARQFCKRNGWVIFDRPCSCWRMTDKGRASLRAVTEIQSAAISRINAMDNMHPLERVVLESMNGGPSVPWGAAVSASLEWLSGQGYCTRGPNYEITDKGRAALTAVTAND